MPHMVACTYNPGLGRWKWRNLWRSLVSHSGLTGDLQGNERLCLKKKIDNISEDDTMMVF